MGQQRRKGVKAMSLTRKAQEDTLTGKQRGNLYRLAAILWFLPSRLRYRFFSAFHDDLRRFFESQEAKEGEAPTKAWVWSGWASVQWEARRPKVILKFPDLPVAIEVRREKSGRFRVQLKDGERLVAAVKAMTEAERDFLWALMDEALADYEDHLLATDPELIREHEEALREIERGEYVVYGGEGSG
ncbi:MAG: hypothetical protein LKKZDAJK_000781 [Candidatus Fervidibacter sp.]